MPVRRRSFLLAPLAGAAPLARAQRAAVDPKEPAAAALGYVADAARADKARYPKYAAGQACVNCALYQGGPATASAPCPIFQNRPVPAKAWCNAYVKKP